MKHVWTVLSSKTIVDRHTNMVSIIDACDGLRLDASEIPTFDKNQKGNVVIDGITLYLTSMWFRSDLKKPETGLIRYVVVTPDGKRFIQPERMVDLQSAITSRTILLIDKLVFRGLGLYSFRVEQKKEGHERWTVEAESPLTVTSNSPQAGNSEGKQNTKLN